MMQKQTSKNSNLKIYMLLSQEISNSEDTQFYVI